MCREYEQYIGLFLKVVRLEGEYKKNRKPQVAAGMKKYMRGQFEFYGLKAPERRAIDKLVNCDAENS